MKWTTDKRYVVYKTKNNTYHWEHSGFMFTFKDFDELVPILYTNALRVAVQTAINLNKYHEQRQAR